MQLKANYQENILETILEFILPDAIEYINFAIEMAISDSDTSVEKI